MPTHKPVILRDIAKQAGVSVMTVSRALRGMPNIAPDTLANIKRIAEKLGYRPNPLVVALMSYRRGARPVRSHLCFGFITNFSARDGWRESILFREFFQGAADSADRHGFRLEEFWLREPGMTAQRMSQVLYARNITGLIIAPLPVAQGHLNLDWAKFATVSIGYSLARPPVHRAVNHQFRSMRLAMRQLRKMGFQRPGLAMSARLNERVEHQWVGSFLVEQFRFKPEDRVPLLVVSDVEWNADSFARWFRAHQPEVIISQQEEVLDWLQQLGVRVPEDVGFVHLNCPDQSGRFAGIYQNGPTVGIAAVDFLVGMIHRNERGIPPLAHSILIEGTWVDGKTLKAP